MSMQRDSRIGWVTWVFLAWGCASGRGDSARDGADSADEGRVDGVEEFDGPDAADADWADDACSPEAPEICDGVDNDCDGSTDEGCCLIDVLGAVYAANCGAPTSIPSVGTTCNGLRTCTYTTNYTVDPGYDPAYGCPKDLTVQYRCRECPGAEDPRTIYVPGEAGTGSVITLDCP